MLRLEKHQNPIDSQPRFYGVTVSTEDFKSFSRGSIPRGTSLFSLEQILSLT